MHFLGRDLSPCFTAEESRPQRERAWTFSLMNEYALLNKEQVIDYLKRYFFLMPTSSKFYLTVVIVQEGKVNHTVLNKRIRLKVAIID
jgi:hypothetical protein